MQSRDAVDEIRQSRDPPQEDKKITIKTESTARDIVVEISDTGPGIPEDIIDRIFEPFFTTKAVNKGTGLGLSISQKLSQLMGGKIWVESNLGKGSTFYFTLPLNESKIIGDKNNEQ